MTYQDIITHLEGLANPIIAEHSQRFFKTGVGEYGYGDKFLGIRVPILRKTAKLFNHSPLADIKKLLRSEYHEVRLLALLLLVNKYTNSNINEQERIYKLYLQNTKYINNWDLVDSSAPYIVGPYLADKDRVVLYELCKSKQLWERRIAIMSTLHFIKNNQFEDTLKISELLIDDPEDLIHKAVGWMLREVGNRKPNIEKAFLKRHCKNMPRTMLRYAIEKLSKQTRQKYLKGNM